MRCLPSLRSCFLLSSVISTLPCLSLASNGFLNDGRLRVMNDGGPNGNHALQDYQMQLMLLEQQNKKRLLMARQEQAIDNDGNRTVKHEAGRCAIKGQCGIQLEQTTENDGNWTVKHEAGRCAIKGHCGKQSFFGGELPCPDNSLADEPDKELRKKVVDLCGSKWSEGKMCCNEEQVSKYAAAPP